MGEKTLSDISSDEEDDKNNEEDDEEHEDSQITNKYVVDLIAEFKDRNEDLVLHWGIGKKQIGEWIAADDKFLPPDTKKWGDGKAV